MDSSSGLPIWQDHSQPLPKKACVFNMPLGGSGEFR